MYSFYQTLFGRRDVRGEFLPDPVPDDVLARLLTAAHHAPSVGLSQPWNFVLVRDKQVKHAVHSAFVEANQEARQQFGAERRELYSALKLQGILDAPLNICVTCDRDRGGPVVLGRTHQPDMDLYSTVCAVQNMWLAARYEEIGIGWVSIIKPEQLQQILCLPEQVVPVAYLCLGYVSGFREEPELAQRGWADRLPLQELVFCDRWGERAEESALDEALSALADWPRRIVLGEAPEE